MQMIKIAIFALIAAGLAATGTPALANCGGAVAHVRDSYVP